MDDGCRQFTRLEVALVVLIKLVPKDSPRVKVTSGSTLEADTSHSNSVSTFSVTVTTRVIGLNGREVGAKTDDDGLAV